MAKTQINENKKVYSQEIAKKHGFERAYYDPHHDVEIWERDGRYISVKPEPEMTTDADYVFTDKNDKRTYINPKGKKPVFPSTNKVKLSENELKQIVAESVKRVLREGQGLDYLKSTYDDCFNTSYLDDYTFSDFIKYLQDGSHDHRNFIQTGDASLSSDEKNRVGDYYDPTNPLESWPSPTRGEKPLKKINKTPYGKIGRALGAAGSFGLVGSKSIYNSLRGNKNKK